MRNQSTPNDRLDSFAQHQRDVAARWCQGAEHQGNQPCLTLCADCARYANRQIAARNARRDPFDTQTEPGRAHHYGPADIRVLERDSREGRAELARRAARVEAEIAATGLPEATDEQIAAVLASLPPRFRVTRR